MSKTASVKDTELVTLKPSDLARSIRELVEAKVPGMVWGRPGIGKSQVMQQVAAAMGMDFIDIRAVLLDPVDLRGIPHVVDGKTYWAQPAFLPQPGCRPTIVLIDEINRAPVLVQNGLFQLILDRKLGEYTAPDNVAFFAAGNFEGDGGGVQRMPSALKNRFIHVYTEPDLEDWCKWAVANGVDPLVIAFLRYRPALLSDFDPHATAFATPRSWEFVSKIIARGAPKQIERAMVAGAVGTAATEFMAFVEIYRQAPNVDAILLDPDHAEVPSEVASLYAVSSALAHRSDKNNFGRVTKYLDRIPKEFNVFSVRDAVNRDTALTSTPEFTRWVVANGDVL